MRWLYFIGWSGTRLLYRLYFGVRVYHPERVPPTGPVILASNHSSFLDPPLVGQGITRDMHYLARESLFRFPLFGAVLHGVNAVPVDREGGGARGLRIILDRLQGGAAILLFPEGTRGTTAHLQPARSGIGLIIVKSSAPVVPVRVFGTFAAWGRQHRFPQFRRPIAVKYGHPLMFEAARAESRSCPKTRLKQLYQEVADTLMNEIERLQPHQDNTTFP
jgi:1-acyl-sn-glycerol-3-phosphate acyltransferase